MKKAVLFLLSTTLLGLLALSAAGQDAAENGVWTAEERADAIARLEATRDKVLETAASLSEDAWTFKPGPDRWSVAEVVEHLALTEGFLWQNIDAALAEPVDPEWAAKTEGKLETFINTIPDRSKPATAPEPLQPGASGENEMSRIDLVEHFIEGREKSLAFAQETTLPIKAHIIDTEAFGPVSAHHWLVFIALHNERHNKQIDEILADPKLPH